MADIRYFFIENGGTPDVFSYGGRCWKRLTRSSTSGEVIPQIDAAFTSVEDCICNSGNAEPVPIVPDCDNLLLNVQAVSAIPNFRGPAEDYSPKMYDTVIIGGVTYEPDTPMGLQGVGALKFENVDQEFPAYVTLSNSPAGVANPPTWAGDYSIQYWMQVNSIPFEDTTTDRFISIVIDGRAVGTTVNAQELANYVQRDGDNYRLHHGTTSEIPDDRMQSELLNYNANYHVAISRKDGVERMYINGDLHDDRNNTATYNNKNIIIGQHPFNFSNVGSRLGFNGYLQDIRIANIATHNCVKHTVDTSTPTRCNSWRSLPEFEYGVPQPYRVVVQASSAGWNSMQAGWGHYRYQKIYIDGVQVLNAKPFRGMLISKLREVNGTWELVEYFGDTQDFYTESNVDQAQTFLQSFEDGELLVLNTSDDPHASGYTSRLYDELQTFGAANSQYSSLNHYRSSYLLISIKGMLPDKQGFRFFRSEGSNSGSPLAHTIYLF